MLLLFFLLCIENGSQLVLLDWLSKLGPREGSHAKCLGQAQGPVNRYLQYKRQVYTVCFPYGEEPLC